MAAGRGTQQYLAIVKGGLSHGNNQKIETGLEMGLSYSPHAVPHTLKDPQLSKIESH